jgi:BirA family biotin operon repressor/biotin-[acetyl-CoA-carboxylase] ligase
MPPRWRIRRLEVTASTNDDARRADAAGEAEGLVIVAARQTSGRGRHGRVWDSPEGNLHCSVLLRPDGMPERAGLYGFVAALAVYDVVSAYLRQGRSSSPPLAGGVRGGGVTLGSMFQNLKHRTRIASPLPNPPRKGEGIAPVLPHMESSITLKWPNDVLANGKKISGILAEVAGDALIVGIGLNVAHHPDAALYPATSLAAEGARLDDIKCCTNGAVPLPLAGGVRGGLVELSASFDSPPPSPPASGRGALTAILDMLLERFGHWHDVMQAEGFAPIRAAWLERAQRGDVTARLPQETLQGRFGGIDEQGRLRLILADGAERAIATGDVVLPLGN